MHPRIAQFDDLHLLDEALAEQYHLPAEFAPQRAVWVAPPHNAETWPAGTLPTAQAQFANLVDKLADVIDVWTTDALSIATNDAWIRDYGPLFVRKRGDCENASLPELAIHDFRFNSWGGKYDAPQRDDVVPQHIAAANDLPLFVHDMVLEGGSIDVNGKGTLLTTEQCLLNANRNPDMSRQQIEAALRGAFGVTQIIWLPGGIVGDDTDGHVDDIARFVAEDTVVAVRAPANHPDHEVLERNWQVLQSARDQAGKAFNLVPLPVPQPLYFDYPGDRFTPARREQLPCSYANFLISNDHVFVPVFGVREDEPACRVLEEVTLGRHIVPIRSESLVIGQGAVHCLTMQEPSVIASF